MLIDKRGFTLIELLVVIAIIGVLSSVVLASLNTARTKAQDAKRLSDLHSLTLALELYYSAAGTYPAYGPTYTVADSLSVLVPTHIPSLPSDPVKTGWENYRYCGGAANYTLLTYTSKQGFWCSVTNGGDPCGWSVAYAQCR